MATLYIRNSIGELVPIKTIKGDPGVSPDPRMSALGYITWWKFDNETQTYIDTGIRAEAVVQIEDSVITFTEDTTRENIVSGDVMSIILGKIKKWFTDLKALAFKDRADWDTDIDNKPTSMPASDVYAWAKDTTKPSYAYSEITDTPDLTLKADLVSGKVPSIQLPSYVDDVIEGTLADVDEFRDIENNILDPESGKIYVDLATDKQYRWGGSLYTEISKSLAIGETADSAFAGNRGVALENKNLWKETHTELTTGGVDCSLGATFTITASSDLTITLSNLSSILQGSECVIRVISDTSTSRTITLPSGTVNETGMTTAIVNNSNSLELNIKRFGEVYAMKGVLYE